MNNPDFEGTFPPNAVVVHEYTVGYGTATGMDEDGVTSHPLVAVIVNPVEGPMLILEPVAAAQLCLDVARTLPETGATPADRRRMRKLLDLGGRDTPIPFPLAFGYAVAAVLVVLMSVVTGRWENLFYAVTTVLAVPGVVAIMSTLLVTGQRWREKRKKV